MPQVERAPQLQIFQKNLKGASCHSCDYLRKDNTCAVVSPPSDGKGCNIFFPRRSVCGGHSVFTNLETKN